MDLSKEKSCGEKIGFRSHAKALNFMANTFKALHGIDTLKPYKCLHCSRWHLGHYRAPKIAKPQRVSELTRKQFVALVSA